MPAVTLHLTPHPRLVKEPCLVPIVDWASGRVQIQTWLKWSTRDRYLTLVRIPADHPDRICLTFGNSNFLCRRGRVADKVTSVSRWDTPRILAIVGIPKLRRAAMIAVSNAEAPTRPAEGKHTYRRAFETGNWKLLGEAFAPDAKAFVPPWEEPIVGREAIVGFLQRIAVVFAQGGDYRFIHELSDAEGHLAIVFTALIPGVGEVPPSRVTTTDLFEFDEYDRITTMTAMTRPIQALHLMQRHGIR
jgi:hypothetical protein